MSITNKGKNLTKLDTIVCLQYQTFISSFHSLCFSSVTIELTEKYIHSAKKSARSAIFCTKNVYSEARFVTQKSGKCIVFPRLKMACTSRKFLTDLTPFVYFLTAKLWCFSGILSRNIKPLSRKHCVVDK